jgi:hypothetical protein
MRLREKRIAGNFFKKRRMNAMPLKIVIAFKESDEGWSEVYYTAGTDPSAYISANNAGIISPTCDAALLIVARAQLLNLVSGITHIRVSAVGAPRQTAALFVNPPLGSGAFPVIGGGQGSTEPAEIFSKLLIRMNAGTVRTKTLWLGGIPEQIIGPAQFFTPTNRWNTVFTVFRNLILQTPYVVLGRQLAVTIPAAVPITAFTTSANGQSATVTPTVAPAGPPAQWYVIVRGIKNPRGWNGVHRAQVNPADGTMMILGPTRKPVVTLPAWAAGSGGTVQALAYPTNNITGVHQEYITHRKVGRPFDEPRGRRP